MSVDGTDSAPAAPGVLPLPRVGAALGRYELVEILGHGAMATVFRARDRNLGREVALKVMNVAMAARSDSAERFRREAQAVAAVKHRGIVEIFDFVAATVEEPAYIVSELIAGPTLRRFLDGRRRRVLPEAAALLAAPVAEALGVAHARGIVHRDIKPDNVMIECRPPDSRVVLTDFGVAHVTGLETMTATGALVGSPAYMSPEQARGHDIGPASDIWALGVLLYEMATGQLPFVSKDPLLLISAIARGQCKRPSQVSRYVGPAFDELVGKCLRAAPEERYTSATALAEELRRFCRAAGLDDDEKCLRRFLADPDAFEAELGPRLATRAVAAARKHTRRGEFARALGELSRATEYDPKNTEAARLITSISSRRRWLKVGGAVTAGVALAVGLMVGAPAALRWWRARPAGDQTAAVAPPSPPAGAKDPVVAASPPLAPQASGAPGSAPPTSAPGTAPATSAPGTAPATPAPGVAAPATPDPPTTQSAARGERTRPRPTRAATSAAAPPAAATTAPAGAATPAPTASASGPAPSAPAPVAAPPVAPTAASAATPRLVTVQLRSTRAFCDPSLDGLRSGLSPKVYPDIAPGEHQVFCQMPGGEKIALGSVNVPARESGEHTIQIVRDKETGRPTLAGSAGATRPRQADPGAGEKPAPAAGDQPPPTR